jgi:hypothetical protein
MDYYEIKEREVNDIRQNSKQRGKRQIYPTYRKMTTEE